MNSATDSFVLKGAHVIDAEQGIDRVADVHVADGKIQFVGSGQSRCRHRRSSTCPATISAPAGSTSTSTPMARWALPIPTPSASIRASPASSTPAGPGIGVLDQFMDAAGPPRNQPVCRRLHPSDGLARPQFHRRRRPHARRRADHPLGRFREGTSRHAALHQVQRDRRLRPGHPEADQRARRNSESAALHAHRRVPDAKSRSICWRPRRSGSPKPAT